MDLYGELEKRTEALEKDIKAIAGKYNIPESELIIPAVKAFLEEHGEHGGFQLQLEYVSHPETGKDTLAEIFLHCKGFDLKIEEEDKCSHRNSGTLEEAMFSYALIYQNREFYGGRYTKEIGLQAQRREGVNLIPNE